MGKLLPCPFCGGKAVYVRNMVGTKHDVSCKNERCRGFRGYPQFDSVRQARKDWNKRPSEGDANNG